MPNTAPTRAAIYIKETAGYPTGENSKELQTSECEQFCLAQEFNITTRYYDPPGDRHQFDCINTRLSVHVPPQAK